MFDREALRAAAKPRTTQVHVSEWGQVGMNFTIRELRGADVVNQDGMDENTALAKTIVRSVVDPETCELVFTDADIPEILGYGFKGLLQLNKLILEFNSSMTAPIEQAVKN